MFKKTLIAMTVASASLTATAGILTFDVTESTALADAITLPAPTVSSCATVAAAYNATVISTGFTPSNTTGVDTVTVGTAGGSAGIYDSGANTMTYTGNDACELVINSDTLVPASAATYSAEGAAANGVTVAATLVSGVGGVTDEDTIIITVEGGVVDEDASAGATLVSAASGSTFTLLGVVDNTILFTVDTGDQVAREYFDLSGLVVTADDGADSISLSAATQNTANVQYDTSDSAELVVLETQYSASVEAVFDGIIDVSTSRKTLAVNADDSFNDLGTEALNEDTLVIAVEENTTNGNLDSDEIVFTLTGDFSWMAALDETATGAITSDELANGFTYASHTDDDLTADGANTFEEASINEAFNVLAVTISSGSGDVDAYHTFSWNVPGVDSDADLNETPFTVAASSFDGTVEAVLTPEAAVGEWTLNGSVVEVPYLPFGPITQPILRHTNTGIQTGDIAVRYMVEGEHTTWQELGVMVENAEPGLTNLLSPVTNALAAEGFDASVSGFKVALEVTTNVPGGDVTVFAAAKITSSNTDRLTVGDRKSVV